MARMSIDDSAGRDPRVKRLGRALGWSRRETLGALFDVWSLCYDRLTPFLPAEDVNAQADHDGAVAAMVEVGLATEHPEGVRIAGATERIDYLLKCREAGRMGGEAKARNADDKKLATLEGRQSGATATLERPSSAPVATSYHVPDPVPDSPPDPVPDQGSPRRSLAPLGSGPPKGAEVSKPRGRSRIKPGEATEAEMGAAARILGKLSQRNGVVYEVRRDTAHVRLIVRRLRELVDRDRSTEEAELELRYVIGYCAEAMEFQTKPGMQKYLRPETLFGPDTFEKYHAPAIAWVKEGEYKTARKPAAAAPPPDEDLPDNVVPMHGGG